ncbi:hypothetical protein [Jannaschia ovalis]|uniref:Uncharacterized protein n=1 Tax=Jannaschia ovalis TaxID=3038773 RepID=A0ABY8LG91_9RHOB|nr:hypothetical protein [Jannaschia sp. GRR-S6-38]WGH79413.1 hypothetical protein P8627_03870 [Jannaschia sp. GRR-S6-38]
MAALALSLGWLGLVGWFFLTMEPEQARLSRADPLGFMMTILGVFLPVALIWVAAAAARTARIMREESGRLQAAIDAMRLSYLDQQQMAGLSLKRDMEERIEQMGRAQAVLRAELASLQAQPEALLDAPARPQPPEPQPALALDGEEAPDPLPPEDFVRALDFPRTDRDREGFAVLRRALEHHPTARVVTAAQDVLTLLSQDGIYMDDLVPDHADVATWRRFAEGARGAEIAALSGIRDRSSLALTAGRMRDDTVFRDTVHHFLRSFDAALAGFAPRATDHELMLLADSRSGRAFMLTGRVAGIFG